MKYFQYNATDYNTSLREGCCLYSDYFLQPPRPSQIRFSSQMVRLDDIWLHPTAGLTSRQMREKTQLLWTRVNRFCRDRFRTTRSPSIPPNGEKTPSTVSQRAHANGRDTRKECANNLNEKKKTNYSNGERRKRRRFAADGGLRTRRTTRAPR